MLSSTLIDGSKRTGTPSLTARSVSELRIDRTTNFADIYTPLEYHSWNAGPRSCLGRALATYEGIAIVCAIMQRFEVQLQDPAKEYEPLPALNMVRSGSGEVEKRG